MASETNYQRYQRTMKSGGKKKARKDAPEDAPKKAKRTSRRREGMDGVWPALGLGALDGGTFSLADEYSRKTDGRLSADMEAAYEDQPIAYGAGKMVGSMVNPIAMGLSAGATGLAKKGFIEAAGQKRIKDSGAGLKWTGQLKEQLSRVLGGRERSGVVDASTLKDARNTLNWVTGGTGFALGGLSGYGGWQPGDIEDGDRLRDAGVGAITGALGTVASARLIDEAPTIIGKPRISAPSVAYGPRGAKAFMDEGLAFDELAMRNTGTQRPKMSRQARAKKADGYTTPSRLKDTMVKPVLARAAAQSGEPEIGRLGLEIDGLKTQRTQNFVGDELARIEAKARPVAPGTDARKPQAIARVATEDPDMSVYPTTGKVPGNMIAEIDALPREQRALVAQLIIARMKGLPPPPNSAEAMQRLSAMGSEPMRNLMRALSLPVPRVRMKTPNPANPANKVPVLPSNTPEAGQQRELEDMLARLEGLSRSGKDAQGEMLPIDLEAPWTRIGRDAPGGVAAGQRALNRSQGRLDEGFAQEMLALRDQPIDVYDPKLPANPELPLLDSRKIPGPGDPLLDAPPGLRSERAGAALGAGGEWFIHALIEALKGEKQGAGAAPAGASR